MAGLQQPVAIALVLVTFPLCWLMDRLNVRSRRRLSAHRSALLALPHPNRWQRLRLRWLDWHVDQMWGLYIGYVLVVFIYGWIFVGLYARQRVIEVRQGGAARTLVRMNGAPTDLRSNSGAAWTYLGAISNYVFVYDPAAKQAMILPVNAVAGLQPLPSAKRTPVAPKP